MFWQAVEGTSPNYLFTVFVSRTEGGVWQPAHELLPQGPWDTDIENFSYADTSDGAGVMGVITRYESGSNRFWAFRHGSGGWQPTVNPYTSGSNLSTRVRTIFYHGARAMATLFAPQRGQSQLTSLQYTGIGWMSELIDVPESLVAYYQDPIAHDGEAVLVFEGELSGTNKGIKASWLRHRVGDVNCDGTVDVADLLELLAAWGPCPAPPPDCTADFNGDGIVDVADLLVLLANWG